ncbi:MAG: UDP-N-acetylglucosamine 1-carboxyvinyltransferase [Clostridia bacterium]|nr:UDP-N-acetylglucosamine 1-carboxyvinyltransferase [Clostridia bacterium]
MEVMKIYGPTRFSGSVDVQGSKNAVLPMIAAAVINAGVTVLRNCPDISDVHDALDILKTIGCDVSFTGGVVRIDSSAPISSYIPECAMRRIRASFIFTGALLARCKEFTVSQPGGCNIGLRPVDIHLEAFKKLGANICISASEITCKGASLAPCDITLRFPSVGATENVMILASSLKGTTRIINAAREPEIEDLQYMLTSMGAKVSGAGSSVIVINGTDSPVNLDYTVMPDRVDTATYLTALACGGGSLTINKSNAKHLLSYINILKKCGMDIELHDDCIKACKSGRLHGNVSVTTTPYPGFATDMQSLLMSVLCLTDGIGLIKENIFENRFCLADTLIRMGADIRIYRRTASVRGVRALKPVCGCVCDLRSGAALAAAMMSAEGISELTNIHYIDRGYEDFAGKYQSIGAKIERIERIDA